MHAVSSRRGRPSPDLNHRGAPATSYVPRLLLRQLAEDPERRTWTVDGTVVFVDISGFTKLSERLAKKGKEGAEQVTEAIEACFTDLLAVAYANGGGLIKFGGDALLLLFQGDDHEALACRSAVWMRRSLREVGRIELPGVGCACPSACTRGRSISSWWAPHRELIATGPAWSRTVQMEHEAGAGEILVSPELAALLPARCLGDRRGPGVLLRREPSGVPASGVVPTPDLDPAVAGCLSVAVRDHVTAGGGAPEHRPVTVAFLHFDGTDEAIARGGRRGRRRPAHPRLRRADGGRCAGVCFLATDVDADGGKLILTAGAPSVTGNDEERMLRRPSTIADSCRAIPVRVGVHRGALRGRHRPVVPADLHGDGRRREPGGPAHGPGRAGRDLRDRRRARLLGQPVPHGGARPVRRERQGGAGARVVGRRSRRGPRACDAVVATGRSRRRGPHDRRSAGRSRAGRGGLVEIVGEPGIGKTRLIEETVARGRSPPMERDLRGVHGQHPVRGVARAAP